MARKKAAKGNDKNLGNGKVKTAAGGTRNAGGGLAVGGGGGRAAGAVGRGGRSAQRRSGQGASNGTISVGGRAAAGGLAVTGGGRAAGTKTRRKNATQGINNGVINPSTGGSGGLVKTANDPYRPSGLTIPNQGGKRASKRVKDNAGGRTVNKAGVRTDSRKADAIRALIKRGGTEGEKAAARAAADRMGIKY